MLNIGDLAPDFELPDQDGRPVRLSEQLSRGSVLLYFYPADFTPVCTREACAFRDLHSDLAARAVTIFGISPQDSISHARFRAKHALPFTLLADPEKHVISAYGCDGLLGFGVRRATYLIGRDRRILGAVHSAFSVSRHMALAKHLLNKN